MKRSTMLLWRRQDLGSFVNLQPCGNGDTPSSSPRTPQMPPIPFSPTPRIVIYYQTQHNPDGTSCSILPIITQPNIAVTHVILAAIHLNDPPGNITLVGHRRKLFSESMRCLIISRMIMLHIILDISHYGPNFEFSKPPASKLWAC